MLKKLKRICIYILKKLTHLPPSTLMSSIGPPLMKKVCGRFFIHQNMNFQKSPLCSLLQNVSIMLKPTLENELYIKSQEINKVLSPITYIMAIPVVEFSNQGYKDICLKRKLLNFENWINGGLRSFQKSEFQKSIIFILSFTSTTRTAMLVYCSTSDEIHKLQG